MASLIDTQFHFVFVYTFSFLHKTQNISIWRPSGAPSSEKNYRSNYRNSAPLPPRAGVPARLRGLASSGRGALWPNLNLWISTHPGASGCSFSPHQIQIQIQIQVMQIQIQFKQKQLQKQTQIQLQSILNPWSMTDVRTFQCPMYATGK